MFARNTNTSGNKKNSRNLLTDEPESVDNICSHFYTTRDTTIERRFTHEVWKSLPSCTTSKMI